MSIFRLWEEVYYLDSEESFPYSKEKKGYWAGTADNTGDALTYWIVPENADMNLCKPIPRSVIRSAADPIRENRRIPFRRDVIENEIDTKVDSLFGIDTIVVPPTASRPHHDTNIHRHHETQLVTSVVEGGEFTRADHGANVGAPTFVTDQQTTTVEDTQTKLINPNKDLERKTARTPGPPRRSERIAKAQKHQWNSAHAVVVEITKNATGFFPNTEMPSDAPTARNSLQLPLEQEVSFIGLTQRETERMAELQTTDALVQDDDDVSPWDIVEILSHRTSRSPRTRGTKVVKGIHLRLKAKFRDGGESWIQADAARSDNPFAVVQYAVRKNLTRHKWFSWTQAYLTCGKRLDDTRKACQAAKARAPKYKFGVEVPKSPQHALYLDKVNGNKLWEESMQKEFESLNQHETFRVLEDHEYLPDGYKRIPYHIVFDVKFDLRRKSRLVAGGNWCDPPKEDVYSGVVSLDTIRLGFLLGSMNNLSVCAADVGTAFLYGKTTEKVFVTAGPEFGPGVAGKRMVIDKGLYGLRSSSARFHEHLSTKLRNMGFLPSKADADFWYRESDDHYEYIATYVDDLLVFSRKPMMIIDELRKHYVLKGIGIPEYYLGGNVEEVQDRGWNEKGICIALSARTYIESSTKRLEELVGKQFPKQTTPMLEGYHPELDDSPFLDPTTATKYRAILGSAGWCVTLGRFDVAYATNTLARFSMAPREGHYKQAQRIFGYLSNPAFIKGRLFIDPNPHNLVEGLIKGSSKYDWTEFYPNAEEELPPKGTVPPAKGPKARITVYVDADHAHDQVTRRSVSGILVFVNNTLVRAYTKRQRTVETSTYGSELVASRIATEIVMEYRFALRSLGVEIDGPAVMLGDNNAVVLNTTLPSSQLKKKHQAICYHRVREAIACGILEFYHIPTWANYSDVLTKPVSSQVFHNLIKPVLFRASWREDGREYYANDSKSPRENVRTTTGTVPK